MRALKVLHLFALLATTAWLARKPGWDSAAAALTLLSTFLAQDLRPARSESQISHDRELFAKFNSILQEDDLRFVLDNDLFNFHTDTRFMRRVEDFVRLAERTEGRFLARRLQRPHQELAEALKQLERFVSQHFFPPRDGPSQLGEDGIYLKLYPELRDSDDEKKRAIYRKRAEELPSLIDEVDRSYKWFRSAVKSELAA